MRILITDKAHPVLPQKLRAAGHEVVEDLTISRDRLLEEIAAYDALIVRSRIPIDRAIIDRATRLRCIGREGAGMDTIDTAYAESWGIRCLNSPEGNRDAVGEHTLGLLLALADKIARADAEVRQGRWDREGNRGFEIKGKTVGIIGFGNMGAAFAQRLQGFECRIMAYDNGREPGYAPAYVEEATLAQLQHEADIVSLHIPLDQHNRHLCNAEFFNAFRKNFYLLNAARGAVVDTDALVAALQNGKVLGAGLDVLEYEDTARDGLFTSPLPAALQYLTQSPRVVLTPHVAGWTIESKVKLAEVLADKIIRHLC